jgi:hypothetical protein
MQISRFGWTKMLLFKVGTPHDNGINCSRQHYEVLVFSKVHFLELVDNIRVKHKKNT